jgi:hypothetical protein
VPNVDVVTSLSGSATVSGSLPYEVANAGNGDTIGFATNLKGGTITLGDAVDINKNLSIDGTGSGITVNSGGNRVFVIEQGVVVGIYALTITGGVAPSPFNGGGIFNKGSLTLINSTVIGNAGDGGGGIYNASTGLMVMSGDTVNNNTAVNTGGGVRNDGELVIINCTIAANTATAGGGIANFGTLRMADSTVAYNTVTGGGADGGGIYDGGGNDLLALLSTIVYNPNSGAATENDVLNPITQAQGDLFGSGTSAIGSVGDFGGNQFNVNPLLGPLQNNGGPTATMALQSGSPALGAGAGTSLIPSLLVQSSDQRGDPRPSSSIDIGAFQTQTAASDQAPAIPSANNATLTEGAAAAFTITTTGTPTPSLSEMGSLPNGVKFIDNGDGTATLTGTPTVAGQFPITITASNGVLPVATQSFTLTVLPVTPTVAPALTSPSNTTFVEGRAGTFTVTATGTPTPSLSESGPLPNGVQFIDNGNGTATLAGTPTVAGQFPITITASNGVLPNATQKFTLTVLTPQQRFVQALYLDFLHRAGDLNNPNDAGAWGTALSRGMPAATVANLVARSLEALGVDVDGLYHRFLGRDADSAGRAAFVGYLQAGGTLEGVSQAMLASSEYQSHFPGDDFVQSLYRNLLQRTGSSAEVNSLVALLSQLGRAGVVQGFLSSPEFRAGEVGDDYAQLLHRTSSAAEVNSWVGSGLDLLAIDTLFAASPEFQLNA